VEEMAVLDNAAYGELLAEALPRVIQSDRENERLIARMERIDSLPHPTPAQKALSGLIAVLVEEYERRYDLGHAEPLEALKYLMEDRGVRQRDLVMPGFGSSSVASDVLNGKREISKQHAKRLAEYFSVPVSLFI
jgi:HTH-type transcriptional regulator/antitoxin HigA